MKLSLFHGTFVYRGLVTRCFHIRTAVLFSENRDKPQKCKQGCVANIRGVVEILCSIPNLFLYKLQCLAPPSV